MAVAELQDLIDELAAKAGPRFILGIVGAPGAGKSTAAGLLVDGLNAKANQNKSSGEIAVVVPMDGFHRYNAELQRLGLFELKGVPASFDADAFINLLTRIKDDQSQSIGCPSFDRRIEEPTPDAIFVKPEHKIVVVEGNYLLLDTPPWDKIRGILDECWFIEADQAAVEERLLERHIAGGRDAAAARKKMESTDLPNARLVDASKNRAAKIVTLPRLSL